MKPIPTVVLSLAVGNWMACAEIPAGWSTNYAVVLSAAGSNQQPALVYFTASWCGPCKLMSRVTLTDPAVVQAISSVEHVAVDIDEQPDLASKHHIDAVPTFLLVSTPEVEVDRTTGFQITGDFLQWLTNGISGAKKAQARQTVDKTCLADVDQLLVSTETNSIDRAAAKLFALCDERDPAVIQGAADRLKILADRDPAALLDGLNDARLSTRIQVANALRYKIGDSFDVDPWSDAATREKRIRFFREEFAKTPNSKIAH